MHPEPPQHLLRKSFLSNSGKKTPHSCSHPQSRLIRVSETFEVAKGTPILHLCVLLFDASTLKGHILLSFRPEKWYRFGIVTERKPHAPKVTCPQDKTVTNPTTSTNLRHPPKQSSISGVTDRATSLHKPWPKMNKRLQKRGRKSIYPDVRLRLVPLSEREI